MCIIHTFKFRRRYVSKRRENPPVVEPVDPRQGRELDGFDVPPGALSVDQLRLVGAVDRLREGVVVRVADAANGRMDAGFGKSIGVADRQILHAVIAVVHEVAIARSLMKRLLERVEGDVAAERARDAPADDGAGRRR